ncbi:MAG: hypothetical protein Q9215_003086 [Flavoplaca cf. flavocitrina]
MPGSGPRRPMGGARLPLSQQTKQAGYLKIGSNEVKYIPRDSQSSLNFATEDVQRILKNSYELAAFEQAFENGIHPKLLQFLRGEITFKNLERCEQVTAQTNFSGIYGRLYRLADGSRYVYIGSSVNITNRQRSHNQLANVASKGKHYEIAHRAISTSVILLASVPIKRYLLLAEQLFFLLFGSYFEYMIQPPSSHTKLHHPHWIQAIWNSVTLWRIASESYKLTGWVPPVLALGAYGLNTLSPIAGTTSDRTIWTRTTYHDAGFAEFRRPPQHLYIGSRGAGCLNVFGKLVIQLDHRKLPDLKIGDQIGINFELKLDGQPHATPYAPLPLVGKYIDWRDTSYLALRVEWRAPSSPTGWFATYVQRRLATYNIPDSAAKEKQQSRTNYGVASNLVAAFRRQVFEPLSAWRKEIPDLRILDISYDHLNQAVSIKELIERQILLEPVERDPNEIRQELLGLGFVVAAKPPAGYGGRPNRQKCDHCFLWTTGKTGTCSECQKYGLLCTWTEGKTLHTHPHKDAISPPRVDRSHKIYPVSEPKWYTMGQELSTLKDTGNGPELEDFETELIARRDDDEGENKVGEPQSEEMDVDSDEAEEMDIDINEEGEGTEFGDTGIELGTPIPESEEDGDYELGDVLPHRGPKELSPEL